MGIDLTLKVPDHFYKYRSMQTETEIEHVRQIVLDNQLYFSSPASFNDPFDFFPVISLDAQLNLQREFLIKISRTQQPFLTEVYREALVNEELKKIYASPFSVKDLELELQTEFRKDLEENVAIFCVSEVADDLLMWAHYADSHFGICLEFKSNISLMTEARQIQYSQIREPIDVVAMEMGTAPNNALLIKSEHWGYEKEWRIVIPKPAPCRVAIPIESLTGIVIGALARPKTVELVKEWNNQRAMPLTLRKARTSNEEFKLIIEDLQ